MDLSASLTTATEVTTYKLKLNIHGISISEGIFYVPLRCFEVFRSVLTGGAILISAGVTNEDERDHPPGHLAIITHANVAAHGGHRDSDNPDERLRLWYKEDESVLAAFNEAVSSGVATRFPTPTATSNVKVPFPMVLIDRGPQDYDPILCCDSLHAFRGLNPTLEITIRSGVLAQALQAALARQAATT